jgi:hypothetical protein
MRSKNALPVVHDRLNMVEVEVKMLRADVRQVDENVTAANTRRS